MKFFCVIALMIWSGVGLSAQTNELAVTNQITTAVNQAQRTQIFSDNGEYQSANNQVIYRDHVVVLGDKFKLTCAQLTAHLTNGHADIIIAITNVVINIADPQKGTNLITAERADYLDQVNNGVTNNTITLTGDPKISNDRGIQEAEKMVWDRQTGNLTLSGGHGILNHGVDLTPAPKPANSQAPVLPGTNLPPVVVGHTNQ